MNKLIVTIMALVGVLVVPAIADPNQPKVKEVNKPIFDIYLGEPIGKVKERFTLSFYSDMPGAEGVQKMGGLQKIGSFYKEGKISITTCVPLGELVEMIQKMFDDKTEDNYKSLKESLQKNYPDTTWVEQKYNVRDGGSIVKRFFFGIPRIDGVEVCVGLMWEDFVKKSLYLTYDYKSIGDYSREEIIRRKAEKNKDL